MSVFQRMSTDGVSRYAALEGVFSGPRPSPCWLIGGGRSLTPEVAEEILKAPVPRMCINLAGTGLLRPNLWTSYDPSARFHRSVYMDPGVMKFVHRRRAMDLVPETTYKVCECPQTYFFERDPGRGFGNFLSTNHQGIADWADSMVQAIDVLYRLGFRRIYLAGCEMRVRPGEELIQTAKEQGVAYSEAELLSEFMKRCRRAGLTDERLGESQEVPVYHFPERKSLRSAANTDFHYFRVAQYLRLSRRSLAEAGVELISVTPGSRLNDYFRFVSLEEACREMLSEIGDPAQEEVAGRYRLTGPRLRTDLGPMRDFKPHRWNEASAKSPPARGAEPGADRVRNDLIVEGEGKSRRKLLGELEIIQAEELIVDEEG